MTFSMMFQAAYDFWRGRDYGLKEYVIRDGERHPFALICPGGGYGMVCSFIVSASAFPTQEIEIANRIKVW